MRTRTPTTPDQTAAAVTGGSPEDAIDRPYRPGNRDDFDRLYRTSYPRVRATLMGLLGDHSEAEDCAQETFVRAYRRWGRWRPDAPAEAWVHRIAINVAISHRRRRRGFELIPERLRAPDRDGIEALPERHDLLRALRALPPRQAAAIVLRHLHGYSNREIAAALGVPERTIASRLAAARARLRGRLDRGANAGEMGTPDSPDVSLGDERSAPAR